MDALTRYKSTISQAGALRDDAKRVLDTLNALSNPDTVVAHINGLIISIRDLTNTRNTINMAQDTLKQCKARIEALNALPEANVEGLLEADRVVKDLRAQRSRLDGAQKAVVEAEKEKSLYTNLLEAKNEEYTELLTQSGVCPTCFQKISDKHLQEGLHG